jgi:hypothetical protein
MRRHMRSHNCGPLVGLRCPYPGCDRTFKRSDSLLNHCRKHHPEVDGAPAPGRTQYFDKRNNESKPGARHDEACGFSDTGDAAFVDSGNSRRPSESTLAQSPKISHRDHGNYTSPNGSDPAIQSIKTIEILSSKTLGHSTNPSSVYTNVPEVIIDSLQDVNDVTTYTQANSPPFPSRIPLTAPRDHGELLQGGGRTTTSTTSHENQTESKESGINDGFSGTAPELDESSRFALEDMEVMPHEARQAIIEQAIKRFLDWFSQIDMRVLRPEEIVQHSVESVSGCIDGCMSDHNEEMGSSASGSGGKISDWKQSTQPLSNTLRKRKVGDSGNGSDDNNDEDDQNKRRIPDSKTRPFSKIVSRFACPFFKRNPERQIRSSCFSLGFQNVTRVKYDTRRDITSNH